MNNLEPIIYNQDSGYEAIAKLDRNQRAIKNALDVINVDGIKQQINVLSNDRGYKTSKLFSDIDSITENGKYVWIGSLSGVTNGTWYIDVTKDGRGFDSCVQIATCIHPTFKTIRRIRVNGVWRTCEQFTTVAQLQALIDANNA